MVAQLQPWLLETDTGVLEAFVPALPAQRVATVWHPRGWQVVVIRLDGEEFLPTIYEDYFDAETKAVELAVELDVALICDDDPTGEIADGLIEQRLYAMESYDRAHAWQL